MYSLPYKPDQIEDLLFKLSLQELSQIKEVSKLKLENLCSFISVFVYRHGSTSRGVS